jgi:uncharacterized protein (DUF924 family)
MHRSEDVLRYWFGDLTGPTDVDSKKSSLWWMGGPEVDAEIAAQFGDLVAEALSGGLVEWTETPRGTLALVILLDQFTRNIGRGTADAFAGDARALETCLAAIDAGVDRDLRLVERAFLYMPLMHAEDPMLALRSKELFGALSAEVARLNLPGYPDFKKHADQHADIVLQFGRYPHRNEILGRTLTGDEILYLADAPPNFGQK